MLEVVLDHQGRSNNQNDQVGDPGSHFLDGACCLVVAGGIWTVLWEKGSDTVQCTE